MVVEQISHDENENDKKGCHRHVRVEREALVLFQNGVVDFALFHSNALVQVFYEA